MTPTAAISGASDAAFQLMHAVQQSITVKSGEYTLFTYHYGNIERFPYCHPVNLPPTCHGQNEEWPTCHGQNEGPSITLARPFDHDWHLGLFFAWKYINGINVWEGADANEAYGGMRHVDFGITAPTAESVGFWHETEWHTADQRPLLADHRTVTVCPAATVAMPHAYCMDWAFRFTPLTDEILLDRKVEWGGYAGLSVRFPRSFHRPQIRNANGETQSEDTHRASAVWSDYSGWLDGYGKRWGGVTMIDHPANPRYPTPWLTYLTPDLQFLNAAFVRDEPYKLVAGETLALAYRVVIHWDVGDADALDAEAAAFAALDPAQLRAGA